MHLCCDWWFYVIVSVERSHWISAVLADEAEFLVAWLVIPGEAAFLRQCDACLATLEVRFTKTPAFIVHSLVCEFWNLCTSYNRHFPLKLGTGAFAFSCYPHTDSQLAITIAFRPLDEVYKQLTSTLLQIYKHITRLNITIIVCVTGQLITATEWLKHTY